jgi:protein-L-isoaspartate(D-aspartate) O-methyltransferase
MMDEAEYTRARQRMVREQLQKRGIVDAKVLEVMQRVPRHLFVSEDVRHLAYSDAPLPIEHRQTISQPYIVALMTQLLELTGEERVLEIGTGSGYQAAILSHLASKVITLERIPELSQKARSILQELHLDNVEVHHGDGSQGFPEQAPYAAIIVTAAAPKVPQPLKDQLTDGGRLVLPVGDRYGQMLERWCRRGDDYQRERIAPVAFVPLVGNHGWSSEREGWFW